MKIITIDQVITKIEAEIASVGSQSAWAKRCKISASYLHDVLHKRRSPGEKILAELGLTEIRGFAKVNK